MDLINRLAGLAEKVLIFTANDYRLKYRNTHFGYIWSLINPLLMLLTLYVIFSYVMKLSVPNYQIFLLIGIITWNYFTDATTGSLNAMAHYRQLLKKHKVNPYIVIIASCCSSLVNLLISTAILVILIILLGIRLQPLNAFVSIYGVFLLILTVGVALVLSALYIHFKDITHIWSYSLLIGFWLSPIIYSERSIPANILRIYMLNPLARIISHIRNAIIYNYLDSVSQILITLTLSLSVLFIGIYAFNVLSKNMREDI